MKEITEQMLALAAKGNQYAIEDLYTLTYNSVYKAAKALIQDEDTVLDIVQDSYIKAFQSLDQLDCPENFRAWIKRIATNKAKDYLKKKKPILFSEMASEDGEEIDFRDENLDHIPEEVLDRKETARLMDEILASLSEDQRMAIGLHYYQDMSVKEIAELMGCSENTVKSRLNYGRKKVEAKVRELEKKGTKLYSLAPLPFLLWLFRMDAEAMEIPSAAVLEGITSACAAGSAVSAGAAGAASTAGAGSKAAAAAGVKSALATKVAAGVLAATVAGGGIAMALSDTGPKEDYTHDELLSAYQEACRDDCSAWRANREAYSFLDDKTIGFFHSSDALNIIYCDRDLDGNGSDELLIGLCDFEQNLVELDCIYTFEEGYAVPAMLRDSIPGKSEYEDSILEELALTGENTVFKYHGSGDGRFEYTLWKLSDDGVAVEQIGAFSEDITTEQVTFDGQTMSSHEFRMNHFENIVHTLPWKVLVPHPKLQVLPTQQESAEYSFDTLLADIGAVLTVSAQDYDSNAESYDAQYSHLGEGIVRMLLHRQAGDYTMCIWNTYLDTDGDGQEELCIGRGVSPGNAEPIVIYKLNGEAICGDALYAYTDLFYGSVPIEWNYLGG